MAEKKLRVTLIKSPIGNQTVLRRTVKALGFKRLQQTMVHPDNDAIRGMIFRVKHLLAVEEVTE